MLSDPVLSSRVYTSWQMVPTEASRPSQAKPPPSTHISPFTIFPSRTGCFTGVSARLHATKRRILRRGRSDKTGDNCCAHISSYNPFCSFIPLVACDDYRVALLLFSDARGDSADVDLTWLRSPSGLASETPSTVSAQNLTMPKVVRLG